jgi:hypothetical protein
MPSPGQKQLWTSHPHPVLHNGKPDGTECPGVPAKRQSRDAPFQAAVFSSAINSAFRVSRGKSQVTGNAAGLALPTASRVQSRKLLRVMTGQPPGQFSV